MHSYDACLSIRYVLMFIASMYVIHSSSNQHQPWEICTLLKRSELHVSEWMNSWVNEHAFFFSGRELFLSDQSKGVGKVSEE